MLELRRGAATPSELVDRLGVSKQLLSNHIACLRGCGLVVGEREGRNVRYGLATPDIAAALADLMQLVLEVDPNCCQGAAGSEAGCACA